MQLVLQLVVAATVGAVTAAAAAAAAWVRSLVTQGSRAAQGTAGSESWYRRCRPARGIGMQPGGSAARKQQSHMALFLLHLLLIVRRGRGA